MEGLPLAALLSQATTHVEVRSALPDAPVVPVSERRSRGDSGRRQSHSRPKAARTRTALARALERAAAAVAPGPTASAPRS